MSRHTDEDYISADPFSGDESDLQCRTIAIHTARKRHQCYTLTGVQDHTIEPGDRYRHERALVDGSFWGEYRICLTCMDGLLSDLRDEEDDDKKASA